MDRVWESVCAWGEISPNGNMFSVSQNNNEKAELRDYLAYYISISKYMYDCCTVLYMVFSYTSEMEVTAIA